MPGHRLELAFFLILNTQRAEYGSLGMQNTGTQQQYIRTKSHGLFADKTASKMHT